MKPINRYRVWHSWRRYGQLFSATTTWLFPGTASEALSDFTAKRKEVVSCRIVKEEL